MAWTVATLRVNVAWRIAGKAQHHQPARLGHRKGAQHRLVEQGEYRRACANRQSQRKHGGQGKSG